MIAFAAGSARIDGPVPPLVPNPGGRHEPPFTRADAVKSGASGAGIALAPWIARAQQVAERPLITKPIPSSGEPFRSSASARTLRRRDSGGDKLPDWAAEFDASSWAQVFLKYVVSHPAVNAAIPGTTQVRHVLDNQPDADMRRRIERFWDSLDG